VKPAKRAKEMKKAVAKPKTIKDSRFGIRTLPKSVEEPSIFTYANPGRGSWTAR
jgi:hypothetical protein